MAAEQHLDGSLGTAAQAERSTVGGLGEFDFLHAGGESAEVRREGFQHGSQTVPVVRAGVEVRPSDQPVEHRVALLGDALQVRPVGGRQSGRSGGHEERLARERGSCQQLADDQQVGENQ
jgi:hypothetical protein